jgi:hypothetical protein
MKPKRSRAKKVSARPSRSAPAIRAGRKPVKRSAKKPQPAQPKRAPRKAKSPPGSAARKRVAAKRPSRPKRPTKSEVISAAVAELTAAPTLAPAQPIAAEILPTPPTPGAVQPRPAPAPPSAPESGSATGSARTTVLDIPIPAILLEGDEPTAPPASISAPRFAGAGVPVPTSAPAPTERLPEAYGTGRLFLSPRDPYCLCAQWDLTADQLRFYNNISADQHLVIRVHRDRAGGEKVAEIQVHPESRHWFIHVEQPGATYAAELGCYEPGKRWLVIAVSAPVATPGQIAAAEPATARFGTFEMAPGRPHQPAADSAQPEQAENRPASRSAFSEAGSSPAAGVPQSHHSPRWGHHLPTSELAHGQPGDWTEAQNLALADLMEVGVVRRQWPGSAEVVELISRQRERPISSAEMAHAGWPLHLAGVNISSPAGGESEAISSPIGKGLPAGAGFWFNVNAELVVYGATEPDAQVTIGGRPITLRPDGSFSYRFALPDGNYTLPILAMSAHADSRRAELQFYRGTRYEGEVGAHGQDPALKAPAPENLA